MASSRIRLVASLVVLGAASTATAATLAAWNANRRADHALLDRFAQAGKLPGLPQERVYEIIGPPTAEVSTIDDGTIAEWVRGRCRVLVEFDRDRVCRGIVERSLTRRP